MVELAALLVLGLERGELTALVGGVGGVASTVVILAMLGFTLLPAYSEGWAERFGVADAAGGQDPAEVVPGRDAPLPAPGTGGDGGAASSGATLEDVAEEVTAEGDETPVAAGGDPAS